MEHASCGVEDSRLDRFCHDLRQHVASGLLLSQLVEDGDLENEAHVRLATIHKLFDDMKQLINAEVGTAGPRRIKWTSTRWSATASGSPKSSRTSRSRRALRRRRPRMATRSFFDARCRMSWTTLHARRASGVGSRWWCASPASPATRASSR